MSATATAAAEAAGLSRVTLHRIEHGEPSVTMGAYVNVIAALEWADDGVFSRDVIDMAMMRPGLPLLRQALAKAEGAYGQAVAPEGLRIRTGWLERCMQAMQMQVPKAVLWPQIRVLTKVFPKSLTGA